MFSYLVLRLLSLQAPRLELQSQRGQTIAEYGLIISFLAVSVIVVSVVAFRDGIIAAFDSAAGCLSGSC